MTSRGGRAARSAAPRREARGAGERHGAGGPRWSDALAGHWILALLALAVLAFAWRLAYLGRLARTPLAGSLTEDARIYWDWSSFLLRTGPVGRNPFFMGPLYPYALAVLRVLTGDVMARVLVVQAAWGALSVALLADAARRLTRPGIGIAIGALAALYPMAVFFDGLVLMESLLFFIECLLLWLVARGRLARWPAAAALGALIGLLAEGRATSALLLLPAALLLWSAGTPAPAGAGRGADPRAPAGSGARAAGSWPAARLAALAAGFVLVATPAALRNLAVSGEWIPFTYNFGFNLYAGNHPEATGAFSAITGTQWVGTLPEDGGRGSDGREYILKTTGLSLSPAGSSAWWAARARAAIAADPGRTARLALTKLGMLWNRREYPQIENADEYDALAGPLGLPAGIGFALAGTLGLAGLAFAWRRGPPARFAAGYVLVMTLAVVPFFVTDRYRHHLLPALLLLAGLAIDELWRAWRSPGSAARVRAALPLALAAVVVGLPAPGLSRAKTEWGMACDLGARWLERDRPDLAIRQFEHALSLERSGAVRRAPGATAAIERASLAYNYATALHLLGHEAAALPYYERAVEEAPEGAPELAALAEAYGRAGRAADAARVRARLARVSGGEGRLLLAQGWQAARAGETAPAESLFARAVAADASLEDAWTALVRIQIERGEDDRAAATLEGARAAGLGGPGLSAHEALVAAARGDRDAAFRALADVPESAARGDTTIAEVVRLTRGLLFKPH